jgi:hypothetical protein
MSTETYLETWFDRGYILHFDRRSNQTTSVDAHFKLWTFVATGMGLGGSKPQLYLRYDNDFELVIRATKDL